ncbi:MAG: hypothetical protein EBU79_00030 [Betaproteobacteria bacterium]|nr:hypothetical protein [Betaproteobacteria bacterium]
MIVTDTDHREPVLKHSEYLTDDDLHRLHHAELSKKRYEKGLKKLSLNLTDFRNGWPHLGLRGRDLTRSRLNWERRCHQANL